MHRRRVGLLQDEADDQSTAVPFLRGPRFETKNGGLIRYSAAVDRNENPRVLAINPQLLQLGACLGV